jgi:phosphopantothenoylcysteine decarboxylase/phosphopantothenate--cysteine ligase
VPVVVLGVTGCIAAYKACEVVRELQRCEVDVHVVMTSSATRFVGPMTFEALSNHPVFHDQWALGANSDT